VGWGRSPRSRAGPARRHRIKQPQTKEVAGKIVSTAVCRTHAAILLCAPGFEINSPQALGARQITIRFQGAGLAWAIKHCLWRGTGEPGSTAIQQRTKGEQDVIHHRQGDVRAVCCNRNSSRGSTGVA